MPGLYFLKKNPFIFIPVKKHDLVAQPVEQLTLNQWVESSILSQVTKSLSALLEGFFCSKQTQSTSIVVHSWNTNSVILCLV